MLQNYWQMVKGRKKIDIHSGVVMPLIALDLFDWYAGGKDIWEEKRGSFFDAFFHLDDCRLIKLPRRKKWSHKWYRVKNSQRNVRIDDGGAKKKTRDWMQCNFERKRGANVNGSPRGNKRDSSQTMLVLQTKGVRWFAMRRDSVNLLEENCDWQETHFRNKLYNNWIVLNFLRCCI